MNDYTIVAILPDNERYQVAVDVPDDKLEETLKKLSKKHIYRYARFEFFTEGEDNNE